MQKQMFNMCDPMKMTTKSGSDHYAMRVTTS